MAKAFKNWHRASGLEANDLPSRTTRMYHATRHEHAANSATIFRLRTELSQNYEQKYYVRNDLLTRPRRPSFKKAMSRFFRPFWKPPPISHTFTYTLVRWKACSSYQHCCQIHLPSHQAHVRPLWYFIINGQYLCYSLRLSLDCEIQAQRAHVLKFCVVDLQVSVV